MLALERNTFRRGHSAVPEILPRTLLWRRRRALLVSALLTISSHSLPLLRALAGLAFLAAHILAGVADALALIGFRRPLLADFGGKLADLLLVDARDHDGVGVGGIDLDVLIL